MDLTIEQICSMTEEEMDAAIESMTTEELEDAQEAVAKADKKALREYGKGMAAGYKQGAPLQDRNHEASFNAAMGKINSYTGKDKARAEKAFQKGVQKNIGGNIFTRKKRAKEAIQNMRTSSNIHGALDKANRPAPTTTPSNPAPTNPTPSNNDSRVNKSSTNTASGNRINIVMQDAYHESEEFNMFDYDAEFVEVMESIIADLAMMDDYEFDEALESLSADEIGVLNEYIDARNEVLTLDEVVESLMEMDDDEYDYALEGLSDDELSYLEYYVTEGIFSPIAAGLKSTGKAMIDQQKEANAKRKDFIKKDIRKTRDDINDAVQYYFKGGRDKAIERGKAVGEGKKWEKNGYGTKTLVDRDSASAGKRSLADTANSMQGTMGMREREKYRKTRNREITKNNIKDKTAGLRKVMNADVGAISAAARTSVGRTLTNFGGGIKDHVGNIKGAIDSAKKSAKKIQSERNSRQKNINNNFKDAL